MNWRSKGLWVVILVVCLSGFVLVSDYLDNQKAKLIPLGAGTGIAENEDEDHSLSEPLTLEIYIVGEVNSPGQYSLTEGSRVSDAVEKAGGLTGAAILMNNNLARIVKDGEKIIILGEEKDAQNYPELADKLNLNTATEIELMRLNGIGEVLAKRIVADRENNGLFEEVKDILRVKGIGESKLKNFENNVCIY